jgi:hypothetical protein
MMLFGLSSQISERHPLRLADVDPERSYDRLKSGRPTVPDGRITVDLAPTHDLIDWPSWLTARLCTKVERAKLWSAIRSKSPKVCQRWHE